MQVASAGPTELANLATFAVATNNRVLGAALVSVIDAMPARSRPFSAQELADKLCNDENQGQKAGRNAHDSDWVTWWSARSIHPTA